MKKITHLILFSLLAVFSVSCIKEIDSDDEYSLGDTKLVVRNSKGTKTDVLTNDGQSKLWTYKSESEIFASLDSKIKSKDADIYFDILFYTKSLNANIKPSAGMEIDIDTKNNFFIGYKEYVKYGSESKCEYVSGSIVVEKQDYFERSNGDIQPITILKFNNLVVRNIKHEYMEETDDTLTSTINGRLVLAYQEYEEYK